MVSLPDQIKLTGAGVGLRGIEILKEIERLNN
jgi:hypothetical protein